MPEKKPRRKATLPLSQTQAAMDTEYRERKVQEAESDTIACLGRGDISILSALTTQLPDVFYGEILPKTDMWDKLSLAQVSKTYRDTVWSVDGVRSMEPKALTLQMAARAGNLPAVRALLQSGVNPDEYIDGLHEAGNKQICTALHIAARSATQPSVRASLPPDILCAVRQPVPLWSSPTGLLRAGSEAHGHPRASSPRRQQQGNAYGRSRRRLPIEANR